MATAENMAAAVAEVMGKADTEEEACIGDLVDLDLTLQDTAVSPFRGCTRSSSHKCLSR
jgi:hypothetical protein